MSDDKSKTDQGTGDGTGTGAGDGDKSGTSTSTAMPFAELMGHIDSRIESAVRKVIGGKSEGDGDPKVSGQQNPEGVAAQVRAELAKLNGEEAAKQKDANRDVTIQQLQEQVSKLTEEAPTQTVSKLTQLMWGGRKK